MKITEDINADISNMLAGKEVKGNNNANSKYNRYKNNIYSDESREK